MPAYWFMYNLYAITQRMEIQHDARIEKGSGLNSMPLPDTVNELMNGIGLAYIPESFSGETLGQVLSDKAYIKTGNFSEQKTGSLTNFKS